MRVMFSTVSAYGHFLPMAPLARAARAAGHEVVVAAAEVLRDPVEAMGLALLPVGVDDAETDRRLLARQAPDVQPAARSPEQGVVDRFVEVCARAVLDDLDALLGWQPDVIVREEGEFAAPVIAALAGIPFAEHSWGPMRPPEMVRAVAEAIRAICRQHGLEPDAVGEMHGSLYFDICRLVKRRICPIERTVRSEGATLRVRVMARHRPAHQRYPYRCVRHVLWATRPASDSLAARTATPRGTEPVRSVDCRLHARERHVPLNQHAQPC